MSEGANFQKICPFHKNRAVNLHLIMKNRPQRQISFLVVWLTMFSCIWVSGQNPYPLRMKKEFSNLLLPGPAAYPLGINTVHTGNSEVRREVLFAGSAGFAKSYAVPSDVYFTQSGVMCKMEWKLEKASHIPFRFRLGSLADCNALERKH